MFGSATHSATWSRYERAHVVGEAMPTGRWLRLWVKEGFGDEIFREYWTETMAKPFQSSVRIPTIPHWFGGKKCICILLPNTSYNDQIWSIMMKRGAEKNYTLPANKSRKKEAKKIYSLLIPCRSTKSRPIGRVSQKKLFWASSICCLQVCAIVHEHTWFLLVLRLSQRSREFGRRLADSVNENPQQLSLAFFFGFLLLQVPMACSRYVRISSTLRRRLFPQV